MLKSFLSWLIFITPFLAQITSAHTPNNSNVCTPTPLTADSSPLTAPLTVNVNETGTETDPDTDTDTVSATSNEDLESSSSEIISLETTNPDALFCNGGSKKSSLIFSATKPGDGHDTDPDGIPTRFLTMQKGNRHLAKQAFENTLKWRNEHDIDRVLTRPHPKFDQCKACISHYFAGRDKHGHPIFVQQFGKINFGYISESGGGPSCNKLSNDDLLNHYAYILEYCWNILEPQTFPTEGLMTSILDLENVGWSLFKNKEFMSFSKSMVSMISANYPTRSYKTIVINAPGWFNIIFSVFKPLLRKSTREKMQIYTHGKKQDQQLKELLGKENVPEELLTTYTKEKTPFINWSDPPKDQLGEPGPYSSIEQDLRNTVRTTITVMIVTGFTDNLLMSLNFELFSIYFCTLYNQIIYRFSNA